jgi:dTDP-4-amino-4,6-dideoxygalactose transaminase
MAAFHAYKTQLAPSCIVKSNIDDLAIFGASPAFSTALHVGRPNIGNREHLFRRIEDILERRWLTNDGPCLKEFEQRISELVGVKHCIAVCNATVGLEIVIKALGLTGEVILPSFTFVATAHALRWFGITPVFCDIDPLTHNIDPARIAQAITGRTTGILGVHVWGRPCDVDALVDLARKHNLSLLFDAAHAFGCSYKGTMVGNFGSAEIFSFHATKFVNAFEGGAVVTNDDTLATKLRLMRNFGFAGLDKVTSLGINGKMHEVSAAMGLVSLESVDSFVEVNHRNYELYRQQLSDLPGVSLTLYKPDEECNYQYVVLEIDESITGISRDLLDDALWAENVLSRRYFYPGCHRFEPYRTDQPRASEWLTETERLSERVLCLPTGSAVGPEDIHTVSAMIKFIVKHHESIKERMSRKPICRHPLKRSL